MARTYDAARDEAAVRRIWREVGWATDTWTEKAMDAYMRASQRVLVADVHGEAECVVLTAPGTLRHDAAADPLPLAVVTGVATSRVARKQGTAARLTAQAVAADADDGAPLSSLGIFEQGFYDRLGFGTGGYVHRVSFAPSSLAVPAARRPPQRLSVDDFEAVHACRLARRRWHGQVSLRSPHTTHADILEGGETTFGLGWRDADGGALSHMVWLQPRGDVEVGPYDVMLMAWRTRAEFRELMGLLRGLGDQVHLISLTQSNGVQLQDLVRQPFRFRRVTRGSNFDAREAVVAWWQTRMNDVPACLAATRLPGAGASAGGAALRFNLELTDPIEAYLAANPEANPEANPAASPGARWRGVAGDYVVTLDDPCRAEPGADGALPTLACTVNAFTRWWLGVRRATALELTDDFAAPPALLAALDRAITVPDPQPDWAYWSAGADRRS